MRRALACVALLAGACGDDAGAGAPPYDKLSQYGFFQGDGHTQQPAAGVVSTDMSAHDCTRAALPALQVTW